MGGNLLYQAVALRGTERSIFHASKLGEGLVQELDGPSLDAFVLGPKEGSNGHEGREVRTKYLDTAGTLGISIPILEHAMGYHGRRNCFLFVCQ